MKSQQLDFHFVPPGTLSSDFGPRKVPLLHNEMAYDIQADLARYLGPPWLLTENHIVFSLNHACGVHVNFFSDHEPNLTLSCVPEQTPWEFVSFISELAHFHGCQFYASNIEGFVGADASLVFAAFNVAS